MKIVERMPQRDYQHTLGTIWAMINNLLCRRIHFQVSLYHRSIASTRSSRLPSLGKWKFASTIKSQN